MSSAECENLAARVRTSSLMLDEKRPGWYVEIDLEKLDISKPRCCIIGQLYPTYRQGIEMLKLESPDDDVARGFDSFENRDLPVLTNLWTVQIKLRIWRAVA